jgi:hypothetical protein
MNFISSAKKQLGLRALDCTADPAEVIAELEPISTRAVIRSVSIGANLRAIVPERLALVDIKAFLGIGRIHDVSFVAKAEISALSQVVASVFTASASSTDFILTFADFMAASFISVVSTIVAQIANLGTIHAITIGTFEIAE